MLRVARFKCVHGVMAISRLLCRSSTATPCGQRAVPTSPHAARVGDEVLEPGGLAVNIEVQPSRGALGQRGFLAAVPWIQAFIWAFKPTTIVDIRRYPKAEAEATAEEISRLRGQISAGKPPKIDPPGTSPNPKS